MTSQVQQQGYQPVQHQQVVVVNQPLAVHGPPNFNSPTPGELYRLKQSSIFFWFLIVICVLLIGMMIMGGGLYVWQPIVAFISILIYAFTVKDLLIVGYSDHIYIGFGPLKACGCCLQWMSINYTNVETYGEYPNQCWYPLGYKPAFFDPMGGDCCINWFFPGMFCCTNTWFYNNACILCCCVVTSPQLVVLKLRNPVTCCCHTLYYVAVSMPDSRPLSQFLGSQNVRNDRNPVSVVQYVSQAVIQQIPQQVPQHSGYVAVQPNLSVQYMGQQMPQQMVQQVQQQQFMQPTQGNDETTGKTQLLTQQELQEGAEGGTDGI